MRDLKNKLTSGKNTKNTQSRKGKSFGYQVLGFGSGQGIIGVLPVTTNYLVVAGGGGGGTRYSSSANEDGGGGGAGGYRATGYGPSPLQGDALDLDAGTYPVTIGAGGAGTPFPGGNRTPGSNTVWNGITSAGGGGGGTHGGSHNGDAGGSGGGSFGNHNAAGNTPPTDPPQGNQGGSSPAGAKAGGGGGAGGLGGNSGPPGAGAPNLITGSDVTYAVGGAGAANGAAGTTNRGNGGDGRENNNPGGAGGPGVVILRFATSSKPGDFAVAPGTNTVTTTGTDTVCTFTVSGTITV